MRDDGAYRRARDVADDAAEDFGAPRLHPAAGGFDPSGIHAP